MPDISDVAKSISGTTPVFSEILETGESVSAVESTVEVTSLTGTAPTLDIIPQYSYDKINWFDSPIAYSQKTGLQTESVKPTTTGNYFRFKYVLGGPDNVSTSNLYAVTKKST